MNAPDGEGDYELVAAILRRKTGLRLGRERSTELRAAIARAIERGEAASIAELARKLEAGDLCEERLVSELTVGETYFFRGPEQFDFVRRQILPMLVGARSEPHRFRVWSAGCSSGEEAFSLAMLLEDEGLGERSSVLGTDISIAALAKARSAVYREWSLRHTGVSRSPALPHMVHTARSAHQGSSYRVADSIRNRVRFEPLNLASDAYPSIGRGTAGLDLIFCRNVLLYLDEDTVSRVARKLYDALAEGGWLVFGPADPGPWRKAPFKTVTTEAGVFCTKESAVEPERVVPVLQGSSFQRKPKSSAQNSKDWTPASAGVTDGIPAGLPRPRSAVTKVSAEPSASLRVRLLIDSGRREDAAEVATASVRDDPASVELRFLSSVLLLEDGKLGDAARELRRVLYLDRNLALAHFMLGVILRRQGKLELARRAYRSARDLCASRPPAEAVALGEGEVAGRLGRAAEAELELLRGAGPVGAPGSPLAGGQDRLGDARR